MGHLCPQNFIRIDVIVRFQQHREVRTVIFRFQTAALPIRGRRTPPTSTPRFFWGHRHQATDSDTPVAGSGRCGCDCTRANAWNVRKRAHLCLRKREGHFEPLLWLEWQTMHPPTDFCYCFRILFHFVTMAFVWMNVKPKLLICFVWENT